MLIKLTTTQAEGILNSLLANLGLAGTQVEIKDFSNGSAPEVPAGTLEKSLQEVYEGAWRLAGQSTDEEKADMFAEKVARRICENLRSASI